ncbi:tail fiber [Stenotrophomonas phage Piffle]|uniref:Tail fiber n=1 Tax=Stenotrophomonas phage Piffle TaxID=2859656 RepID=A0AAE7WM00_9CAUD|nr:tail fiber [Stenotrophomonas phage Piffle]QYW01941.1 tail fiber [Stenotrophomonas phage Piffle]
MNMRTCGDPYGGLNPLVDRVLGPKAYDIVRFVAVNMNLIAKAAAEPYARLTATGKISGPVTNLLFPTSIPLESLVDSTVWLIDPLTGARYNAESGYFTTAYTANGVTISLSETAPVALQAADVLWFMTVGVIYVPAP